MRAFGIARRSALKAQQAAWRQIGALLITASATIRDRYRDLPEAKLVAALANTRPTAITDIDLADTLYALRSLARRHRELTEEIDQLQDRMRTRATAANPALLAIKGIGPVIGAQLLITARDNPDRLRSEASFAALCGVAPVPVSSGRTDATGSPAAVTGSPTRPCTTSSSPTACPTTHAPAPTATSAWPRDGPRRTSTGRSNGPSPAIVFRALTGRCAVPDHSDLRPARHAKNLTLSAAATHLGVWPATISQLERGRRRNDGLANAYRAWLSAA